MKKERERRMVTSLPKRKLLRTARSPRVTSLPRRLLLSSLERKAVMTSPRRMLPREISLLRTDKRDRSLRETSPR